jgi:SPP1 family predicted phage head-tail adaptor
MRPVRAGKLRKRVIVEVSTETISSDGQPLIEWQTFAERYASVEPIETTGREYLQGAAIEADITHTVTMRWFAGVTPKHRINYGGRMLEIYSTADVEERGRRLVCFCKEQIGRP